MGKHLHGLLEKDDSYALRGVCMIMIIVHHTYLSAIDMRVKPTAGSAVST